MLRASVNFGRSLENEIRLLDMYEGVYAEVIVQIDLMRTQTEVQPT